MAKVYILKGLPASGKSTFARELVAQGVTRVNRDDLRDMMHNYEWSKENEKLIVSARDWIIDRTLREGRDVVVDDTNLVARVEKDIRRIAQKHNAEVEVRFFDTPVEECIARDAKREGRHQVGEQVIRKMQKIIEGASFKVENPLTQEAPLSIEPYEEDPNLPWIIICDMDGTLANMCDRSPYDWKGCINDYLNPPVADVLEKYSTWNEVGPDEIKVLIVSGRDGVCRPETEKWLESHGIAYDALLMRPEGDNRKDNIVKLEIFNNEIRGKYNILFIMDDRNQVVEMWRSLGLTVFQVAPGDF